MMSTPGRVATGAVTIALLTACGGSGNDIGGRGGGGTGYAYIATTSSSSQGSVIPYAISGDGALSPLSSGPVPTGMNPTSIVADPTGHYVYVVNQGDATISQFSVGSGGALTALSPAVVSISIPSAGVRGYAASIDPNGHYLYVADQPYPVDPPSALPTVLQFSIGSGGALTPLSPSSVNLSSLTTGPLAIDPGGQHAYVPAGAQVFQFSISNNGTLVPLATPSVATTGAVNVTIAPDGRTAYVLSSCIDIACDGQISVYSVAADGTLSPTGSTTGTAGHVIPIELETDTSGSSAYLLANLMGVDTDAGSLYQFAIGSTGTLQPDSPPSVNVTGGAVAASVFGPSLYALDNAGFASGTPQGGHIDHYAIGAGGLLTAKDSVSMTSGYPMAMTIVASH
jgi:DNA-binding beta-propeller fold protein YncE